MWDTGNPNVHTIMEAGKWMMVQYLNTKQVRDFRSINKTSSYKL